MLVGIEATLAGVAERGVLVMEERQQGSFFFGGAVEKRGVSILQRVGWRAGGSVEVN